MTVSERQRAHGTSKNDVSVYLDSGQLTELGRFHFLCVESAKLEFGPAMVQPLALDPNVRTAPQPSQPSALDLHTASVICYGRDHYAETLARQNALMASVDRSLDEKA